jgi:AcrR family transcriptional regulator
MTDLDNTYTSKNRLLFAATRLFAQNGYEQTSTASIAREAGTSESQLVRYFGGKAGLLQAIFDASWGSLHDKLQTTVVSAPTAREALMGILWDLIQSFRKDPDVAQIFLFEGRRIRGGDHEIFISEGFRKFSELLGHLIDRGRLDGSITTEVNHHALRSAVIGASEGMIRDRLTAERLGKDEPFGDADIRRVMEIFLGAL